MPTESVLKIKDVFATVKKKTSWLPVVLLSSCLSFGLVEQASAHGMSGSSQGDQNPDDDPDDPCEGDGAGKPVRLFSGVERYSITDLSVAGNIPIQLERRYDSKTDYDSPLGHGWAFDFDRRLFEYPDNSVVMRKACGEQYKFVYTADAYVTPGGINGELEKDGSNGHIFTYLSGYKDFFDSEGRLVAKVAPDGHFLEFAYTEDKKPLTGTSKYSVDPTKPMTVAWHYQLLSIAEFNPYGDFTGNLVEFEYSDTTGRLTKATTSDGREVVYKHDTLDVDGVSLTQGNLVEVIAPDNKKHQYGYNDSFDRHNVTSFKPGDDSQPFVNTYDQNDRVIKQQYGNLTLDISYEVPFQKTKLVQTIVDDNNQVIHTATNIFEYNEAGYLVKKTLDSGQSIHHEYNDNNEIVKSWRTSPTQDGQESTDQAVEYEYDSKGNVISETTYSVNNSVIARVSKTYTDTNKIASETRTDPETGETRTVTYSYYEDTDQLKSVDGPREDVDDITTFSYHVNPVRLGATSSGGAGVSSGRVAVMSHNESNGTARPKRLHKITNALGHSVRFESYRPTFIILGSGGNGGPILPHQIVNANGTTFDLEYTRKGALTKVSGGGSTTNIEWHPYDRIKSVTTNGNRLTFDYIAEGNQPIQPIQASAGLGRVSLSSGSGGGSSGRMGIATPQYDTSINYLVQRITDSKGNSLNYAYTKDGILKSITITDADGNETFKQTNQFDALGRIVQVQGQDTSSSSIEYDANGNPTVITDQLNQKVVQTYNSFNQVTSIVDAMDGKTELTYNVHQEVSKVKDAEGRETIYEYNAFGELTKIVSPDTGTTTYTYDKAGNVTSQTDNRGITVTFSYDAISRLTEEDYPDDSQNITYTYDDTTDGNRGIGRLTSVQDPSGSTSIRYNGVGQVLRETRVIQGQAFVTNYSYSNGRMSEIEYPGNLTIRYRYTNDGDLIGIDREIDADTSEPIVSNIGYLPFGPAEKMTLGNGVVETFNYSNDYVLQSISSEIRSSNLTYNAINNITAISDSKNTARNQTFEYDALDRLTSASGSYGELSFDYDKISNRLSKTVGSETHSYGYTDKSFLSDIAIGIETSELKYDANGNTIQKGDLFLGYNEGNRLSSVSQGTITASYLYNAKGERVLKNVNGSKKYFIYDIAGQLIAEANESGVTRQYVYFNGLPVAQYSSGETYFYHSSHLGTPEFLTDRNKTIVWEANYSPFGKANVTIEAVENNIRFPGQYFDSESGLHYNYFRDYDPETGRYIEGDPLGLFDGTNTFGYAQQNPIMLIDPLGLWSWGDPLPQGLVDGVAGFGDAFGAGLIRDALGIDGGVNKCSPAYNTATAIGSLWGPMGRLGYIAKVSQIPRRAAQLGGSAWKQARRAYKYRKLMKSYFRGRTPWRKWLERRDPTWDSLKSKKSYEQILQRSGGHNKSWNIPLLYAPLAGGAGRIANNNSECNC